MKILLLSCLLVLTACAESELGLSISDEINEKYCECFTQLLEENENHDLENGGETCKKNVLSEYVSIIDDLQANKLNMIDFAKFTYRTNSGIGEKCKVLNSKKLKEVFRKQNFQNGLKRSAEKIIGTSFNLAPGLECFENKVISYLIEDPDYNPNNINGIDVLDHLSKDEISVIMAYCLEANIERIGSDRILNIDPDFISQMAETLGQQYENSEYDVTKYLNCVFANFNERETSKDFLMRIDSLDHPLNQVDSECYLISLFPADSKIQI